MSEKKILTAADVAELLQISRSTVYAMCDRKELVHFRIGIRRGTIRIYRHDLDAYLASRTFPAKEKP